jgi:hypothetical protein
MCIAGKWTIGVGRVLGWIFPPRAWGVFELYRKS